MQQREQEGNGNRTEVSLHWDGLAAWERDLPWQLLHHPAGVAEMLQGEKRTLLKIPSHVY